MRSCRNKVRPAYVLVDVGTTDAASFDAEADEARLRQSGICDLFDPDVGSSPIASGDHVLVVVRLE
jgi:hypothetical protein